MVVVPEGVGDSAPMIVGLHGGGSGISTFASVTSGMRDYADGEAIFVYPQGVQGAFNSWDRIDPETGEQSNPIDSVAYKTLKPAPSPL